MKSIDRRQFARLAGGALAGLGVSGGAAQRRPNILFIMTDEQRADSLGCMGHPLVKTPNIDRLARDGVKFTHFYAASPVCSPNRVSAFTGRYPKTHGTRTNNQKMNDGEVLLPALLRRHGYSTALAGKLHFHSDDAQGLFDFHQEAMPGDDYAKYLAEVMPEARQGVNTDGNNPRDPLAGPSESHWRIGTSAVPETRYVTTWITDKALKFIDSQDGTAPWFCFASFWKPHSPYVIPEPYATMYSPDEVEIPELPEKRPHPPTASNRDRHYILKSQEKLLRRLRAHYYGAITYIDDQVGRLLRAVEERGELDNTIVLFTSDHGNSLGEHGRVFKATPYEGAARVPAIFRYPAALPRGAARNHLADTTCIMPTFLDLAGLPVPQGFESPSARGIMVEPNAEWEDVAFSEMYFQFIRTRDWKLVNPNDHTSWEWQLFDLKNDPGETTNLYGRPEVREIQQQLWKRMQEWQKHPGAVKV